jgi:hypothetical protein
MSKRVKIKDLMREYKQNPSVQYFKYLDKVLNLHSGSGVLKSEVYEYVIKWYNDKTNSN